MKDALNYLYNYFGIDKTIGIPMVVSTITSIFVVFLTMILTSFVDIIKAYNVRKKNREMIKESLGRLSKQINKQGVSYKQYADQLSILHAGNFSLTYAVLYDLETFNQLSYHDIRDAYLNGFENIWKGKLSTHDFILLRNTIRFINETYQQSLTKSLNVAEVNATLNELRNNELYKVQWNVENFRVRFTGRPINDPMGIFFNKRELLIENWINQQDHTMPVPINNYLLELRKLNRENVDFLHQHEDDIQSVQLNNDINNSLIRFQNMKNHLDTANNHYLFLSEQYFTNASKLYNIYKKLVK